MAAWKGSKIMEEYSYILFIALILLSTKILGLVTKKMKLPQVVGALLAGVILGPAVLNVVKETEFISELSEIGVIVLMFTAGLTTDVKELKRTGKASFIIALLGVIVPLFGGLGLAAAMGVGKGDKLACSPFLQHLFIGVVLTATSVSITVETLKELGKLSTRAGNAILGAAIIDDILGIIVLTIVTSLEDTSVNPAAVFGKIALYFVVIAVIWFVLAKLKPFLESQDQLRRTAILALAFWFLMAYVSEKFFGIADITGAYFAGLMLCSMKIETYVNRRVEIPAYLIFSPVFFASIGMKTNLDGLNGSMILFSIILLIIAILSKVVGCGLGAKICKCTNKEALRIGVGMISRGEVALIVAQKGYQAGMLSDDLFAPIVLVVIVTTLITPILLSMVFKGEKPQDTPAAPAESANI